MYVYICREIMVCIAHMYVYNIYIYIYVYIYIYMHVRESMYIYIYICICMYIYALYGRPMRMDPAQTFNKPKALGLLGLGAQVQRLAPR